MADAELKGADAELERSLIAALEAAQVAQAAHDVHDAHETAAFPTTSTSCTSLEPLHAMATPGMSLLSPDATQIPLQASASPGAKRRVDPDPSGGEDSAKRQKTEHPADHGAPGLDVEAMLQNALASFDEINNPTTGPVPVETDAPAPSEARSRTATPGPNKVEEKIMKASSNSTYMIRSMSLPLLGNLAVQILLRLAQQPYLETQILLADHESDFWKDYNSLTSIFSPARRIFSSSSLFFPDDLDITDSDDRETIRMSNLASIAASLFSANDTSLTDIHKSFFSIFVPEDGEYKASLTDLLVDLKTQVFIDGLSETEEPQHVTTLLDEIFPVAFDETLKQRSGDVGLNSAEQLLKTRVRDRRDLFLKSTSDPQIRSKCRLTYSLFVPAEFVVRPTEESVLLLAVCGRPQLILARPSLHGSGIRRQVRSEYSAQPRKLGRRQQGPGRKPRAGTS